MPRTGDFDQHVVYGNRVTRPYGDGFAITIQHHIHHKLQADGVRRLAHKLLKGIAVDAAQSHTGMIEKLRPVRILDRALTSAADDDRLASAGIACILVRLHHARSDDQIAVEEKGIYCNVIPSPKGMRNL